MRLRATLVLAVALLAPASCKKRAEPARPTRASVGQACTQEAKQFCLGPTESVVCVDGKYELVPCRTTQCSTGPQGDLCSNATHLAGEYCDMYAATSDFWKHGCSVDGKSQLRCEGKRWQLEKSCPGKQGCRRVETWIDRGHESRLMCDELVTDKGAACAEEGRHACASASSATVRCSGGKWQDDQPCRGPSGCRERDGGVECDDTLAALDDPCGDDGAQACSVDKKSRLTCKSHKMVLDKPCKSGCSVVTDKVQKGRPGPVFECP